MSYAQSPSVSREKLHSRPLRPESTPKKQRAESVGPKMRSPYRPSTVSGGKYAESRSYRSKYNSRSNDSFERELLEFKIASPTISEIQRVEPRAVSKFLNFENFDKDDLERRSFEKISMDNKLSKFLKCKVHHETYSFLNVEERQLYCSKCFYNKYEQLMQPHKKLPNLLPIENALEWMNRENKNFVKVEGRQISCQIDHGISVSTYNNNFLLKKMDMFQRLITKEFEEIHRALAVRERELKEFVHNFFSQKIRENVDRLQELKFYQDSFKKLYDLNQGSSPDYSIFQFSFTNALKKALVSTELTQTQLKDKDVEIIDFISKKRLIQEIENIGKPLGKRDTSPNTPRTSVTHTRQSSSLSPGKSNIKTTTTANSSGRRSPAKVLPIVNVKALENLSKDKIPYEYKAIKQPQQPEKVSIEQSYPFVNEKHLFFDSSILRDPVQKHESLELFPIKLRSTKKLYSLRHDGPSSEKFHELCDGKGPCIVLCKTFQYYVFGFYSPQPFAKDDRYAGNDNFWIFTLVNDKSRPMVFKIKPEKSFIAMYNGVRNPCLGSTLKNKEDLYIDFDNLKNSCSNVGYAYKLWDSKLDGTKILCGQATDWVFDDIEVYHLE